MDPHRPPKNDGPSQALGASSTSIYTTTRLKASRPVQIDVPPFPSVPLSQIQKSKVNVASPVRRKPLPPSALSSPSIPTFSTGGIAVAVGEEEGQDRHHPKTGHMKAPPSPSERIPWLPTPSSSPLLVLRDLDQFPRGHSPLIPQSPGQSAFPDLTADRARQALLDLDSSAYNLGIHRDDRIGDPIINSPKTVKANGRPELLRSTTMPVRAGGGPSRLQINSESRWRPTPHNEPPDHPQAPKTNMLTSFFNWKGSASSPIAESSPTTISDRSQSPGQSPRQTSPQSFPPPIRSTPRAIDVPRANASLQRSFSGTMYPPPPMLPAVSTQVQEMEEELREISYELAGSIRREMDLEDQVERLQSEGPQAPELSRRTSDYFSDSGTSSVKFPLSEASGGKSEDLQKLKRRSEQEKAQIRLNLSQKLQDERGRRQALEVYIRKFEEHVQAVERNQAKPNTAPVRIQELEAALEDNRRHLEEERHLKENLEDLLRALREEKEQHRNERDNLRDEVVPQLHARLEGLEAEANESQKLTYDHSRMQQEIQSLKDENAQLVNVNRFQVDAQRSPRIGSIAEEENLSTSVNSGLTRSTSLARGTGTTGGLSRSGSLTRSGSVSKERESRESLADRVKEIELQRDALHRALKSLLDRQKYQNKEHEKRVRALEQERDLALESHSPRRRGYEKEVTGLRFEINQLRRRADEALEQKWQCEKGLGGLKKDLDRAEQETGSLRNLLHEKDILIPELPGNLAQKVTTTTQVTSSSLEKAYKDLQATQALSITRLRELRGETPVRTGDGKTEETMDLLLKSMSDAEAERDFAQKQAESYRAQAESLQDATGFHEGENANLAEQLRASANRMDALASQVRRQLESNRELRSRLAETIGRGEREQKASAIRINNMQGRLKSLEDRLMAAQQHSEEAVQLHEDEIKGMRESHNSHLQRLKGGLLLRSPTLSLYPNSGSRLSPRSPRSPLFYGPRSPRLEKTTSGIGISMNEALRTEFLERRVAELERALAEADKEMHEVVQRMNMAQIEVMELQSARDEAMRQTRSLQARIAAESEKAGSLMRFLPI